MKLYALAVFFCIFSASKVSAGNECSKAIKTETYLDTAAELINKIKDNLPEDDELNCKCPPKPMDCAEVMSCGKNQSGVYKIWPRNRIMHGSINVYCDMDTDLGGWTVIQRRGDFKRPVDYFNKVWHHYKMGFGDIQRDFWLGNDNIYALTNQYRYYLRFDLTDFENKTRYAIYDQFWIENESQNYKLHVYDYSGDAGDAFSTQHNGHMFSTVDRNNANTTGNCSGKYKGGWWFTNCQTSNLNGHYVDGIIENGNLIVDNSNVPGIEWHTWRKYLMKAEIKIRPSDFRSLVLDLGVEPK